MMYLKYTDNFTLPLYVKLLYFHLTWHHVVDTLLSRSLMSDIPTGYNCSPYTWKRR